MSDLTVYDINLNAPGFDHVSGLSCPCQPLTTMVGDKQVALHQRAPMQSAKERENENPNYPTEKSDSDSSRSGASLHFSLPRP